MIYLKKNKKYAFCAKWKEYLKKMKCQYHSQKLKISFKMRWKSVKIYFKIYFVLLNMFFELAKNIVIVWSFKYFRSATFWNINSKNDNFQNVFQ